MTVRACVPLSSQGLPPKSQLVQSGTLSAGQSESALQPRQAWRDSLQTVGAMHGSALPDWQARSPQWSKPLQKMPSSHELPLATCSQPVAVHRSSVQRSPSLQPGGSQIGPESTTAESTLASGPAMPPSELVPARGRAQAAEKTSVSVHAQRHDGDQVSKVMEASLRV